MFNKFLVSLSVLILLLSSSANANNLENSKDSINALIECMQTVSIDQKILDDVGSQKIALLSILTNITQGDTDLDNLDEDYSEIYKQVESACSEEIEAIKMLSL